MATGMERSDFIFRSKLPDIPVPNHLPLHAYCFENIAEVGSRPCLINGATGEKYSYDEVRLTAIKIAGGLSKLGFGKGDVVMLLLPNSPEFAFVFLAASFLGAIVTAANPFFTPAEIEKQAKASKSKIIITQAPFYPKVKHLTQESESNSVRIICTDSAIDGCQLLSSLIEDEEEETKIPDVKISPDDVLTLPYSSGTTGLPKGVMLTHKGLVTGISQQVDGENPNLYYHKDDVILCVLPLFHIYALNSVFLCSLRVGATVLLMQKYEIVSLLQMIEKYKVSVVPVVPPIMLAMARSPELDKYDLSSVRVLKSGGAPLGKELEGDVKARFPKAVLGQGYGMTEAGPVLTMSLGFAKKPWKVKAGGCGTVVRNAEMKIVDTETGDSLPRNSRGEICIRGDQIMKGYLDDPKSTARTIDGEGWLHTGDIGFIDDDDELYIVDRLKELIKFRAFQVAPAELEAILLTHPFIADAAVVPMKDDQAGEVPVAFVVASGNSQLTEDEIKQFLSKQVVFYKRLNRVFFIDVIPKSPSGKILRKELRAKLADGVPN